MGLTGIMQESLLALLLYDKEEGKRVASIMPKDCWDSVYREVAARAAAYWDKYQEPPGEQALDFFADLERSDKAKAKLYRRLCESVQETRDGINAKYVMSQAGAFLREQRLRRGIMDAVDLLEQGKQADAETAIRRGLDGVLDVFHPGLLFHQLVVDKILSDERQPLPTGIKALDDRGLGPSAGELLLFIAPPNAGKSWWLVHLAKMALISHRRVVHVTLEMDEHRVAQRFLQAFCAVTKRRQEVTTAVFKTNELGQLLDIDLREARGVKSFADADIASKLTRQLKKFRRRAPLVIRQFPTGMLTIRELRAYLDSLEAQQRIVPDLLCVDYADLMSLDVKDYRLSLGVLYKELRGIAVERNVAVATASQARRDTHGTTITGKDVAEDYSKIATSDTVLTYNQTDGERRIGTARLRVDKARNEEAKFDVLISQSYPTGQFCLGSCRMANKRYWEIIRADEGDDKKPRRERLK